MEIKEMMDFMNKLREQFPCDDPSNNDVRCNVLEVSKKLNMPTERVWEYVGACSDAYFIYNNGGNLKFNNDFVEDAIEMVLINSFAVAVTSEPCCDMPIGFIEKVITNMLSGGKLRIMEHNIFKNKPNGHDIAEQVVKNFVLVEED